MRQMILTSPMFDRLCCAMSLCRASRLLVGCFGVVVFAAMSIFRDAASGARFIGDGSPTSSESIKRGGARDLPF